MNILYISNLTGNQFAGPNHSVPKQIAAQSIQDNILWINLNNNHMPQDSSNLCHKQDDFPGLIPDCLPPPFNSPDLVVFEELYCYGFNKVAFQIMKKRLPYTIIPRSQMTIAANRSKYIKKIIGNILFFDKFIRHASFIHFLTEEEKRDSIRNEYSKSIVIPNGIDMPKNVRPTWGLQNKRIVYIGRYEEYQKGLDILLVACKIAKEYIINRGFSIEIYGHNQGLTKQKMVEYCKLNGLDSVVRIGDPLYGEDKAKVLNNSTAFIMTSRFEGLPMGLIEALAYGLPCIVTSGTNMKGKIVEYDAGWGAELNAESISNAIIDTICACNELLDNKSRNAELLAQKYAWSDIANETHSQYTQILEFGKHC